MKLSREQILEYLKMSAICYDCGGEVYDLKKKISSLTFESKRASKKFKTHLIFFAIMFVLTIILSTIKDAFFIMIVFALITIIPLVKFIKNARTFNGNTKTLTPYYEQKLEKKQEEFNKLKGTFWDLEESLNKYEDFIPLADTNLLDRSNLLFELINSRRADTMKDAILLSDSVVASEKMIVEAKKQTEYAQKQAEYAKQQASYAEKNFK